MEKAQMLSKKMNAKPEKLNTASLEALKEGGVPVVGAFLHQASQLAGTALVERTLNDAKVPTLKMTWTKYGLIAEVWDKKGNLRVNILSHAGVQSCEIDLKGLANNAN